MSLEVEHLKDDLRSHGLRGLKFTFAAQVYRVGLQVFALGVLGRLIAPEEFGLFALAGVVLGVSQVIAAGGLSMATVQRETIDHQQVTALFWVNIGVSILMLGLILLGAQWLANVMDMPQLAPALQLSSLALLMTALGVQSAALLRRQMRFKELAISDVISATAGVAVAISLALAGYGFEALAIMMIVTTSVKSTLVAIRCRWVPGLPGRAPGLRSILSFGAHLAGSDLLARLSASIVPFTLGAIGTPATLGYYNRAYTITSLPSSQVLPPVLAVAIPMLSRVQTEPERFGAAVRMMLRRVILLSLLTTAILLICAEEIIRVALGPGWEDAIPFLQLLSVFAIIEPFAGALAAAMTAIGAARALMYARALQLVLVMAAAVIGLSFGPLGVVAAVSVTGLLVRLPIFLVFALRHLPITWREVTTIMGSGALYFCTLALGLGGLKALLQPWASPLMIVISVPLTCGLLSTALAWSIPVFRRDVVDISHSLINRLVHGSSRRVND